MSVVRPEFLRVLPDDVARVGALGACILALVRYVTALAGEFNGRKLVDGVMWWRASADDIDQSLGGAVSQRTMRWTLGKLRDEGELLAIPAEDFAGDRAMAYRVPDQPSAISDQGPDQPSAISDQGPDQPSAIFAPPVGNICTSRAANIADLPIPEELEEGGRSAGPGPADAPTPQEFQSEEQPLAVEDDPEPARYCPEHPNDTSRPCRACGRAGARHAAWLARQHERNRAAAAARAAAIAACGRCDEHGQIDLGESVRICSHPAERHTA